VDRSHVGYAPVIFACRQLDNRPLPIPESER